MMKAIISGGGSGGHIFPAIAIADKIKEKFPNADILFVGAEGKMEMEKIPKAGYTIVGLPIRGLQRKLTLKNLAFPFRLLLSLWRARGLMQKFKPDLVVGVGGYASGPMMRVATSARSKRRGVKTLLQEQNSYPGMTNKLLASRVDRICVAYPGMEKFFPHDKIQLTGNPVRSNMDNVVVSVDEARGHFDLESDKKTILVFGGSLGARTLNNAMKKGVERIREMPDVQWIWQAGKLYVDQYINCETALLPNVKFVEFIDRMDIAYKAADVAVSRAGALSISELALVGQATILIPSPNVAEDHQTKNATSLVDKEAALLVKDKDAEEKMIKTALHIVQDEKGLKKLQDNIRNFRKPDAADHIVDEIIKLCK